MKMNRVLYLSVLNTNKEILPYDGVMKKITLHIQTMKSYGNQVDYIESDGKDTFFVIGDSKEKICDFVSGGYQYFNRVVIGAAAYIKKMNLQYDYIYIRHDAFSRNGFKALKTLYRHSHKIYLEIPTYYVPDRTLKNYIKYYYNQKLKKYVHRILVNSNEKNIFGIPTLRVTNGVEVGKIVPRCPTNDASIHVALVASISDYHGVNKIIKAVESYHGDRKVVFHIAGDGPKLNEYRQQVKEKNLEKEIRLYGKLTGTELEAVYNQCEIGISSLANKEIGVLFSSTLKSKEYLSKGLPVIADVMLDVFYENPRFFFYELKEDFNIQELLAFYDSVYQNRDKQKIINEIRQYAEQTCDIKNILKAIDDDYKELKL